MGIVMGIVIVVVIVNIMIQLVYPMKHVKIVGMYLMIAHVIHQTQNLMGMHVNVMMKEMHVMDVLDA
jgi:hypothetical protein